jgi:cysteine desulfurase / selenocysteine lyase
MARTRLAGAVNDRDTRGVTTFTAELGSRALFPRLTARVYAGHAAISPHSVAVREAILAVTDDYAAHGVGAVGGWFQAREGLRARLATLLGAESSEVAFIRNTTEGVVAIATGFPWEPGDRVVLYTGEFPTNVTPWLTAADAHDLRTVFLPQGDFSRSTGEGLQRLEDTLRDGARLVAVSAVAFQTGQVMPIEAMAELCHRHGACLFVDAIQALGVVPIDVKRVGVDFLAAGGHKWLMGPEGTGVLYVASERAAELRPRVAGWLSHEAPLDFLFEGGLLRYDKPIRQRADFVESGVPNALGLSALDAALSLSLQLGVEAIHAHVNRWIDRLEAGLLARGFTSLRAADAAGRSGILSVTAPSPDDTVALHDALNAAGVICNVPDGKLRFSPHWPNHLDEVEVALSAVDECLA